MDGSENGISAMIVPAPHLGPPQGRLKGLKGTRTLEAGAPPGGFSTYGSAYRLTGDCQPGPCSGAGSARLRVLPARLLALRAVVWGGTSRQQALQESQVEAVCLLGPRFGSHRATLPPSSVAQSSQEAAQIGKEEPET